MAEAQDFKKIHSKSYQVWRILQAPGVWGQAYRERVTFLTGYRSAIIFPEQLLGLNQSQLFIANLDGTSSRRSATINTLDEPHLIFAGQIINSFQEIYDLESENYEMGDLASMRVGKSDTTTSPNFHNLNLFSNKKDAVMMACRYLEKF